MSIIHQINQYHKNRGLEGNDKTQAVNEDLERVVQNMIDVNQHIHGDNDVSKDTLEAKNNGQLTKLLDEGTLSVAFPWCVSPEGHDYWQERANA